MNDGPTLMVLRGLEGNEPTRLFPLQEALAPYADVLIVAWGALFFATAAYFAVRYVLVPLWRVGR